MKKILVLLSLLLILSCNNLPFSNNDNSDYDNNPEREYIDLQIKLSSIYSLFKALNSGIITQEEYDKLKKEIIE
jgi:hypothetical protein|tara:strand:- start:113 stop:334 length:222 start_codon:yes stop_codon:yes gene_type:complete